MLLPLPACARKYTVLSTSGLTNEKYNSNSRPAGGLLEMGPPGLVWALMRRA